MARLPAEPGPLWQRLAWLVIIWTSSVLALCLVAFVLRAWLKAG